MVATLCAKESTEGFLSRLACLFGLSTRVEKYLDQHCYVELPDFADCFRRVCRQALDNHEDFITTVLRGMSRDSGSNLSVLDQGTETSVVYKKLIAEYLGITFGRKLGLARRAFENISAAQDNKYDDAETSTLTTVHIPSRESQDTRRSISRIFDH